MEDCKNTCSIAAGSQAAGRLPERVIQAAEALARLLATTPEFQALMSSANAVRHDAQVEILSNRINGLELDYDSGWDADEGQGVQSTAVQSNAYEELENQLENLPVVRSYRQAETKARWMFSQVDDCISETVGIAFAENAKPAACG